MKQLAPKVVAPGSVFGARYQRYIAEEYLMFSGPSLTNFSAQSSLLVHAFLFGDS